MIQNFDIYEYHFNGSNKRNEQNETTKQQMNQMDDQIKNLILEKEQLLTQNKELKNNIEKFSSESTKFTKSYSCKRHFI